MLYQSLLAAVVLFGTVLHFKPAVRGFIPVFIRVV
jgi:hypothetical protein